MANNFIWSVINGEFNNIHKINMKGKNYKKEEKKEKKSKKGDKK